MGQGIFNAIFGHFLKTLDTQMKILTSKFQVFVFYMHQIIDSTIKIIQFIEKTLNNS